MILFLWACKALKTAKPAQRNFLALSGSTQIAPHTEGGICRSGEILGIFLGCTEDDTGKKGICTAVNHYFSEGRETLGPIEVGGMPLFSIDRRDANPVSDFLLQTK